MRPEAGLSVEPEKNVGGKKSAEEHYFRCEKKPDADLGVPKASIGPRGDLVRNFHDCSLGVHWNFRLGPSSFALAHRIVLHRVIAPASRKAVFIRPAIRDRRRDKVAVWRRGGGRPFQRGRFPRIVVYLFPVADAPEKINDEKNLRQL